MPANASLSMAMLSPASNLYSFDRNSSGPIIFPQGIHSTPRLPQLSALARPSLPTSPNFPAPKLTSLPKRPHRRLLHTNKRRQSANRSISARALRPPASRCLETALSSFKPPLPQWVVQASTSAVRAISMLSWRRAGALDAELNRCLDDQPGSPCPACV